MAPRVHRVSSLCALRADLDLTVSVHIEVDNVSLAVPLYVQRERRARNWGAMFFGAALDPPRRVMTPLLENVSFRAAEGDRIAILGRNGAGKSTLLRVLNGVYQPTSGSVSVEGSCQALLNMSLGFNGEATVRENIFLRGTAMRLSASHLRGHVESILQFAGLQEKSSHRLRTLSAGQKMRLGFAISTSFQQDIILMDEWVGAGDSDFMARAKERMQSRVGGSKIVMLASHSVGLLRDVCNKGIVLEQGRLVFAGDIASSLKQYHALMAMLREREAEPAAEENAGQLVYGCAETLDVDDGIVVIKGWMTSTEGDAPRGLALEVGGVRYAASRVDRTRRPDVMRHFGLRDPNCGFSAIFSVPAARSLDDLGADLRVLGGVSPEQASTQLRVAPLVSLALKGGT
jgi:ABC-type polysaccharide/polyol phosphate transport system ATPase subunit